MFPLQFTNKLLTYPTFVTSLHLLRVESCCKWQENRLKDLKSKLFSVFPQESAVKTLDDLSETFRKIADDPGTKTGKQIDETAQALLSAVSSIIGASLYTGQETSESNGLFTFIQ